MYTWRVLRSIYIWFSIAFGTALMYFLALPVFIATAPFDKCMDRAREYLGMGVSVLFFPEGTRSHDGVVKPFKRGAFKLALDAGVDILPMGINGTLNALPKGTWKFSDDHVTMRILVGHP